MVTTLVTMHKSEGALFLLCQKKYHVFTRERETDPFQMSNALDYKGVEGVMPLTQCLDLKPSLDPKIFYFMQDKIAVPVKFEGNFMKQDVKRLVLATEMQNNRKIWNIREVAERKIMVSYFGNPSCIIYGSAAAKEEVYDPTFECFGQVTPSKIPAQKSSKDANKLAEEYYRVQSFVDHLNTGLGYYMSRYLTRKLTDQDGYAMLCLKLDSDWSQTTENLVKVFTFNRDCNLKSD